MQKQFTADASHELRTPLTRLKLATSSALSGSPEDYRPALESADKAATMMGRLIEQLLILAQADAHSLAASSIDLDLRVSVADALEDFPEDRLSVQLDSEPVRILGDADLIQRLVRNLVENAMRYGGTRSPVDVKVTTSDGWAVLTVADHGPGIAPEHLQHLFERFYRVDQARSRELGGTGLGLAICKSIVEALNGQIRVKSKVGEGTEFQVALPLKKAFAPNKFLITQS
jgi:signal transduction histidine kinase